MIVAIFNHKILKKIYKFYTIFNSKTDANSAANVYGWYPKQKRVPFSCYTDTTTLDFEDRKFSAIKDYDQYLTALYGDYMTPPPVEQRRTHSGSPVWKD
jgi:phosphorylcholine metabolism protein LicD